MKLDHERLAVFSANCQTPRSCTGTGMGTRTTQNQNQTPDPEYEDTRQVVALESGLG
jgi:hypothetical protein